MPPERRRSVELSIATLVERANEAAQQRRAAAAEQAELAAALNRPLLELIRSDPAAARALDAARHPQQSVDDPATARRDVRAPKGQNVVAFDATGSPEVFIAPYHFSWQWHVPSGGVPRQSITDLPSGEIALDARANAPPDFVDVTFIEAHAGFGISLTTDHPVQATAHALRRVAHSYVVSVGIFASATAEGGEEFTAIEAGNVLASDKTVVFHSRVSGSLASPTEHDLYEDPGFEVGEPMEVTWTMLPGHAYEFNVGQYVICERDHGEGGAESASQIHGSVTLMTLFR